jgi:DNA gyrase subunit A
MRYTESKLERLARAFFDGLDEEAVDMAANYSDDAEEPVVLPCKIPAPCLLNGTQGIGVALATSIPPHNLSELVDGTLAYLDNNDITIEELMQYIKGPDFPNGGQILGQRDLLKAYTLGRGSIPIRGKIELVENKNERYLHITELPYQVTGDELGRNIVRLMDEKKISGIGVPRNETKKSTSIVIPLKKDGNPNLIINSLYKYTKLQTSFSLNLVALDDNGNPKLYTLKDFIVNHVDFRIRVITRQHEYRLKKAEAKLHILEGLATALDNIDAIVALIRGAASSQEALDRLMSDYGLSQIQAKEILDMQLRKLASLERNKIYNDKAETEAFIIDTKAILADPQRILNIIREQLNEIKTQFGNERRTEIVYNGSSTIDIESIIPNVATTVMITRMGYIKRISTDAVNEQRKGTKGAKGIDILDNDYMIDVFNCMTHDSLLIFTTKGKVYSIKTYDIPEKSKNVKGTNLVNMLPVDNDELVSAVIPMNKENTQKYILFGTKFGMACRVEKSAYELKITRGVKALKLKEGDELLTAKLCNENDIAVFGTDAGFFSKVPVEAFSARQSRTSAGIKAITPKRGGIVIGFDIIDENCNSELMIVTKKGIGKKLNITEIQTRRRGSPGTAFIKFKKDVEDRVASFCIIKSKSLILITSNGVMNRLSPENIRELKGRSASGSTIMKINVGDELSTVSNVIDEESTEGNEEANQA